MKEAGIGAVYKFTGQNFTLWKHQLRIALDGREIFTVVDGTETLGRRRTTLQSGLSLLQWTRHI